MVKLALQLNPNASFCYSEFDVFPVFLGQCLYFPGRLPARRVLLHLIGAFLPLSKSITFQVLLLDDNCARGIHAQSTFNSNQKKDKLHMGVI